MPHADSDQSSAHIRCTWQFSHPREANRKVTARTKSEPPYQPSSPLQLGGRCVSARLEVVPASVVRAAWAFRSQAHFVGRYNDDVCTHQCPAEVVEELEQRRADAEHDNQQLRRKVADTTQRLAAVVAERDALAR